MKINKIGNVDESFLTHTFMYNGKECLIGKFSPSEPTGLLDVPFEKLGQELFDQVVDSGVFTKEEMEYLTVCNPEDFLNCIYELPTIGKIDPKTAKSFLQLTLEKNGVTFEAEDAFGCFWSLNGEEKDGRGYDTLAGAISAAAKYLKICK